MAKTHYRPSRKCRPRADDLIYERDLQGTIRQAANLHGYLVYHTHDSRRSPEGFPDLIIAGYGQLIAWELKSVNGALTDAQQGWLGELSKVEGPPLVEVIRPADLDHCLDFLARKGKKFPVTTSEGGVR